MGSLPLHQNINRNAVTASALVKNFQPRDVARTLSAAPHLGAGDARRAIPAELRRPSSTPPPNLPLVGQHRARVIVHPAIFLSHLGATNLICTSVAVDLFPTLTCTCLRENVRHSRVKQKSGQILPSAYAHSSDALHNRKYDAASPNYMTRRPSFILTRA